MDPSARADVVVHVDSHLPSHFPHLKSENNLPAGRTSGAWNPTSPPHHTPVCSLTLQRPFATRTSPSRETASVATQRGVASDKQRSCNLENLIRPVISRAMHVAWFRHPDESGPHPTAGAPSPPWPCSSSVLVGRRTCQTPPFAHSG